MNWWCASSPKNWTWSWTPYLGALAIVFAVIGIGVWWTVRGRHGDELLAAQAELGTASTTSSDNVQAPIAGTSTGRTIAFVFGVIGLWAVLDWPLAALGAGYLATAQMVRQIVMVMVVAPLLLFACPPALAVRAVGWGRRLTVLRWMSRPIVAVPVAAISLIVVNSPALVDPLLDSPYSSFLMDGIWTLAGFTLWMPVQCPHPGVRRLTGATAITYLIGQSIVPVLPGFFMTWADFPIYSTYELAPRVFEGFDAVTDQQTAAAVLQVGGMVLLWVQIAFRFLSWGHREVDADSPRHKHLTGTGAA
ncbi:MAG: cytochrome c oxidase assembly protein [Acidimicrobiales bacterium]|nr:cytochrome c oxidase assembly protein [Acidimicrobiales bacterium]